MNCEKCDWDMIIEALPISEKYKDSIIEYDVWNYHCCICGKTFQDKEMIEWTKKNKDKAIKEYEYKLAHPEVKGKHK